MIGTMMSFSSLYCSTFLMLMGTGLFNTYIGLSLSARAVSEVGDSTRDGVLAPAIIALREPLAASRSSGSVTLRPGRVLGGELADEVSPRPSSFLLSSPSRKCKGTGAATGSAVAEKQHKRENKLARGAWTSGAVASAATDEVLRVLAMLETDGVAPTFCLPLRSA